MNSVCACGCGKPPVGSYWASEQCHRLWATRELRAVVLTDPTADFVRTFCGSTYTETPAGAEPFFPLPERELRDASAFVATEPIREQLDELLADIKSRGWLARWLVRMFGRQA